MNESSEKKPVIKRCLNIQEQEAIERNQRKKKKFITLFTTAENEGKEHVDQALSKELKAKDANDLFDAQIYEVTGASNCVVGLQLLSNFALTLPTHANLKSTAERMNMIANSMRALGPQDEYEGQLIAQLVILHEQAMEWLGRASRTERVDFANVYLNGASKLLNRHHETLEALLKYRRKGEQRVHVEHVHIHGGGQAIVGNVMTGGGMKPIVEEGPHAKV